MFQELTILGNLGQDPVMRYTPMGKAVTQLSVATARKWRTDDGALHEETAWFRVAVFGKMGEACNQYLAKGKRVLVVGTLIADEKTGGPRVWQRKDGTYGAAFEMRAKTVKFLSPRDGSAGAQDETDSDGVTEIEFGDEGV